MAAPQTLVLHYTVRDGDYAVEVRKDWHDGTVWLIGPDGRVRLPTYEFTLAMTAKARTLINSTPT